MRRSHAAASRAATATLLAAVLAGCGASPTGASADQARTVGGATASRRASAAPPPGPIPVGAGPRSSYTVQPQPSPGSCHYRHIKGEPLPDPACNPGATNPKVTQATLKTTICRTGGYTSDIRPPVNITSREKKANAMSYGYTGPMRDAEYDHLISLQLGGDPNDPRNLWVQPPDPGHKPGTGPNNAKDKVESRLHTAVCKGAVPLTAAQQAIATDWTTAEATVGLR